MSFPWSRSWKWYKAARPISFGPPPSPTLGHAVDHRPRGGLGLWSLGAHHLGIYTMFRRLCVLLPPSPPTEPGALSCPNPQPIVQIPPPNRSRRPEEPPLVSPRSALLPSLAPMQSTLGPNCGGGLGGKSTPGDRPGIAGLRLVTFGRKKYCLGEDVLSFFRKLADRQQAAREHGAVGPRPQSPRLPDVPILTLPGASDEPQPFVTGLFGATIMGSWRNDHRVVVRRHGPYQS